MPRDALPTATLVDTFAFLTAVAGPAIAKGLIIRRPLVVGLASRLGLDGRAIRRMQRLRDRYGAGPLMLRVPGQPRAVILSPEHVARVLEETPDPFAADSSEKRSALAHFEPGGVLISRGADRTDRRRYNEAVLEPDRAVHRLGSHFAAVAGEELEVLLPSVGGRLRLDWRGFAPTFGRIVRRVVLGDGARDDELLMAQLAALRNDANWAMARPRRRSLRAAFLRRLENHPARAEPGSLAAVMAGTPADARTAPAQQVPQWLFAFDAVGLTTLRALALLATHPIHAGRARAEAARPDRAGGTLPYLRAMFFEAVRLWPTTPLILRQTNRRTSWENGFMPSGTGVVVYAPFFHRDDSRLPYADRLTPELWMDQRRREWPLVPFSRGPASCPGRELAALLGSVMLSRLIRGGPVRLVDGPRLGPTGRLPASLDPFTLRFELAAP